MYPHIFHLLGVVLSLFMVPVLIAQQVDLEKGSHDFILELKKIEIPGHPDAFNGSIVQWGHEGLIMAFREMESSVVAGSSCSLPTAASSCEGHGESNGLVDKSRIGIIRLDDQWAPMGQPQFFDLASGVQDPRLLVVHNRLYLIYGEIDETGPLCGISRVCVGQLHFDGEQFIFDRKQSLKTLDSQHQQQPEKNWVPFEFKNNLMLACSLIPHKIYWPFADQGNCLTVASSESSIDWAWGELKGGTPALPIDESHYLSFFHSSIDGQAEQAMGELKPQCFMGAYLFKRSFPFTISHISPEPIIAKGEIGGKVYEPYAHFLRVALPTGLLFDEHYIWVSYGCPDHEIWVAKFDKKALLDSLTPLAI